MKRLRIVLADDHTLFRSGVRSLLEALVDVEVVAETGNGRDVLTLVERHRPDEVLMDISMPELNGIEATARIAREHPGVRIIILSMHTTKEYATQALHAGASAYVVKDAAVSELVLAVRAVARGETYLSPVISRHLVEEYKSASRHDLAEVLTPRQREVLQLIAEGNTTKEIARKLGLGVTTVESHRTQVMNRLKIHDIAGLVRYAIRVGLVTPDR